MARRLKCPRCGGAKYWIVRRERRRCARCRYEWRPARLPLHLTSQEWRELLGWFVRGVSSAVIAQETGLHRQRVLRALTHTRQAIAREVSPGFQKEVPFNVIYLGGHREKKSPFQSTGEEREGCEDVQSCSFAIVWDNGKVRIEIVSDAKSERLLPLIPKPVSQDSPVYSDPEKSPVQTAQESALRPSAEQHAVEEIAAEESEINRLRGFWGYLKRQLAGKGGIRRERLPLYLAEYVWRYNHRRLSHRQQVQKIMTMLRQNPRPAGSNATLPLSTDLSRSRHTDGPRQPEKKTGTD